MSEAVATVAPRIVRPRRLGSAGWRITALMIVSLIASMVALLFMPREVVGLAAPLVVNLNLAIFFVMVLLINDRRMPVFESGSLWVAATFIYSVFPFLGFIAAGLNWSQDMDNRLLQYPFDLAEITWFAWQYTMYMASFIVAYLLVRRRASVPAGGGFNAPHRSTVIALVVVFVSMQLVELGLALVYGIHLKVSHGYQDNLAQIARIREVPVLVWQISTKVLDAMLLGKMAVIIILLSQWKKRPWTRLLLFGWLAKEIIEVAVFHYPRATVVLELLVVVMLFHRLVRPLSLPVVAGTGVALLAGFVTVGVLRLGDTSSPFGPRAALTSTNEFQTLFATAFDLHKRKEAGTLEVPWQVYAADFYLEIPRQLLPFEKLDPSVWYLDVLGTRDQGIGYMFGVMAQAVVGFGWIELIVRGAVLGILYGSIHRWYVRRARRFWPTMLYLFIAVWSFYTFRATTFWSVHFLVYQFVPFFLAMKLVDMVVQRPVVKDVRAAAIP